LKSRRSFDSSSPEFGAVSAATVAALSVCEERQSSSLSRAEEDRSAVEFVAV
jgi:hypothetical protein